MNFHDFRITARGLILKDDKLLFVSDDGRFWYIPGGQLEKGESFTHCVEREIFEETGFVVKAKKLLYMIECLDVKDQIHKIHFFFQTEIISGELCEQWNDSGGSVQYRRFFSATEIKENNHIVPRFLANTNWLKNLQELNTESHNIDNGNVNNFNNNDNDNTNSNNNNNNNNSNNNLAFENVYLGQIKMHGFELLES